MSKGSNKLKAKFAVTKMEKRNITKLDVVDNFIMWLDTDNIDTISELLQVNPREATKVINREKLPNENTVMIMREVMNG